MSLTAKSVKSYKKQDLINGKFPTYAIRNLRFAHQATAGADSINLLALTVPTSMSALGFTNPSQSDLLGANFFINRNNLRLVSSARGELTESYDYTVLANGSINFTSNFGTALAGEIFVGTLNNVATTGNLIADTTFILETGTLAANSVSIPVGQSFKTNQNPSKQVGAVVVFIDGQQMFRNVGNATANPSADGDYQEVDNGAGDCTLITLNVADTVNARTYMVMSSWLSVVKPDGSVVETINKQQATIDKVVETLAVVAGVPETDFQAAPTQPQLNQFGDRLISLENRVTNRSIARYTTNAAQSIDNAGSGEVIDFEDKVFDTKNNVTTGASWKFTASEAGYYRVSATVLLNSGGGWGATEATSISIRRSGTVYSRADAYQTATHSTYVTCHVDDIVYLANGQYVDILLYQNSGGAIALFNSGTYNYVSIEQIM